MLDFHASRLDYGTLLGSPTGYILDRALATTYSLDLNALLAIPVALFYTQTLEGDLSGERLALLEAVRQLSEKVTLFHQAGKVQVPAQYNRLYAYLEDCLVPVVPQKPGHSFHPKVWVMRFKPKHKGDPIRFRLLVLSRNLTFDRSWDLAVNLEGEVTGKLQKDNEPVVDFVRYLLKQGNGKIEGGTTFLQQLRKVAFQVPAGFGKLQFHPIGIPGHTTGIPNFAPEHLIVISPFVQDDPLQRFKSADLKKAYLFSRFEELNGVNTGDLSPPYRFFHLNQMVIDGEHVLDVEGESKSQDLHAKLFVQTRKGHSHWLLGSANATNPAAGDRNVEFMLELSGYGAAIQGPRLLDTLLGEDGKKGVFVEYVRPSEITTDPAKEVLNQKLRVLESRLVNSGLHGGLVQAENGANFDLSVSSDLPCEEIGDFLVEIFPLGHEKIAQPLPRISATCLYFENLALVDLSRFIGVKISHPDLIKGRRFLLQMDIELPEERLGRIFSLLLKNQERFFEYLRFLLIENPGKETLLSTGKDNRQASTDARFHFTIGAVYEDLLVAVSRSPEKLKAIEAVIQKLRVEVPDNVIIPAEFLKLWEHFRGYITNA